MRVIVARLINRFCYFYFRGGFELVFLKVVYICNELFEYFCLRVVSYFKMVKEFVEVVFGIEIRGFVFKMILVIFLKFVVF